MDPGQEEARSSLNSREGIVQAEGLSSLMPVLFLPFRSRCGP